MEQYTLIISVLTIQVKIIMKKLIYFRFFVGGVIMAIKALTTPVIVAFYPFYSFWLYSKRKESDRKIIAYITVMTLSLLISYPLIYYIVHVVNLDRYSQFPL